MYVQKARQLDKLGDNKTNKLDTEAGPSKKDLEAQGPLTPSPAGHVRGETKCQGPTRGCLTNG